MRQDWWCSKSSFRSHVKGEGPADHPPAARGLQGRSHRLHQPQTPRQDLAMAGATAGPHRLAKGRDGPGQQERAHRLGAASQGPGIRSELRVGQTWCCGGNTWHRHSLKRPPNSQVLPRRHAFEDASNRSDRQQASSTNPVPRHKWRRRRTNGALLSGWYLGPYRNPSATRPPVDVQSVLCGAASNPNSGLDGRTAKALFGNSQYRADLFAEKSL